MSALDFDQFFKPAPRERPMFNIGAGLDIPTGQPKLGKRGETYVLGGLPYVTGVAGRGNMHKTTLSEFMLLSTLNRYRRVRASKYDSESSGSMGRVHMLAASMRNLMGLDLAEEGRYHLSSNEVMSGDEYFFQLKAMGTAKQKAAKELTLTLPLTQPNGEPITVLEPTISFIDSFSQFTTKGVEDIYEKNKLGEASANTDALRSAAHKTQMLMQVPTVTGQGGIFMIMTAHVGKQHQLDAYAPVEKKLAFLKNATLKNVPEKFTFLTNNLWYVYQMNVLQNKGTKAPEYPRNSADDKEGDTDLITILIQNLRGKNGPTGMPFEVVISQRDGVQPHLTEFHFIKSNERFGISGNDRNYYLDLLPDVTLSRTTVRGKIDENEQLCRALTITSEMCQIQQLWKDEENIFCTPKQLYEDLKAMGYDWNVLLNTRSYWVFEEDEPFEEKPFLSTIDLMRMRKGLYHPFWMPPLSKKPAEAA